MYPSFCRWPTTIPGDIPIVDAKDIIVSHILQPCFKPLLDVTVTYFQGRRRHSRCARTVSHPGWMGKPSSARLYPVRTSPRFTPAPLTVACLLLHKLFCRAFNWEEEEQNYLLYFVCAIIVWRKIMPVHR